MTQAPTPEEARRWLVAREEAHAAEAEAKGDEPMVEAHLKRALRIEAGVGLYTDDICLSIYGACKKFTAVSKGDL